jgi:hypothetical protein
MSVTEIHEDVVRPPAYLEWGPVMAGAVASASFSFLLLSFGAAIGLSLTSAWPETGYRLIVVALVVTLWSVLAHVGSFAAGGYLAGRMRAPWPPSAETSFRDNAHGLMVWAVGVFIGGLMFAIAGGSALKTMAEGTAAIAGRAADGAARTLPIDTAVDSLLRVRPATGTAQGTAPATANPATGSSDEAMRPAIGRILTATIRNREFTARDRDYLVGYVASRNGGDEAEARRTVDAAVNEARDLEIAARAQADKARRAAVITGFVTAASLLVSLLAACAAAGIGGRHRDEEIEPVFMGHRFW